MQIEQVFIVTFTMTVFLIVLQYFSFNNFKIFEWELKKLAAKMFVFVSSYLGPTYLSIVFD